MSERIFLQAYVVGQLGLARDGGSNSGFTMCYNTFHGGIKTTRGILGVDGNRTQGPRDQCRDFCSYERLFDVTTIFFVAFLLAVLILLPF